MDQPNTPLLDAIQPQPSECGERSSGVQESAAHLARLRQGQGSLAGDILRGADAIAEFLYGDGKQRRRVYNLIGGGHLPVFRLGMGICARRSVLLDWIAEQEERRRKAKALE